MAPLKNPYPPEHVYDQLVKMVAAAGCVACHRCGVLSDQVPSPPPYLCIPGRVVLNGYWGVCLMCGAPQAVDAGAGLTRDFSEDEKVRWRASVDYLHAQAAHDQIVERMIG
jgi:hypothetical protein